MREHFTSTREDEKFIPPERVMTRLMRREQTENYSLDYVILLLFVLGVLLGLVVALRM